MALEATVFALDASAIDQRLTKSAGTRALIIADEGFHALALVSGLAEVGILRAIKTRDGGSVDRVGPGVAGGACKLGRAGGILSGDAIGARGGTGLVGGLSGCAVSAI